MSIHVGKYTDLELVFERLATREAGLAPCACASGVSALEHEVFHQSVEDCVAVVARVQVVDEVVARLGHLLKPTSGDLTRYIELSLYRDSFSYFQHRVVLNPLD